MGIAQQHDWEVLSNPSYSLSLLLFTISYLLKKKQQNADNMIKRLLKYITFMPPMFKDNEIIRNVENLKKKV